jgi:hypothetical protein
LALCAALLLALGAAPAFGASLYGGPGHRPGPDILYDPPPPTPPQFQNTGVWQAQPILVSGATSYRSGEFLYQDFLYDDHGAAGPADPNDPKGGPANLFSKPNGTVTYPTNSAYANNAADLVELRVKPLSDATALRVTLNTMKDPSLVAFSIAIGGTPGVSLPFPKGANVTAPADMFLTVHPSGSGFAAELVNAGTGTPVGGGTPSVSVDSGRRQIEVRVPHGHWNPSGVVRLAAGVGLWDKANDRYLIPQGSADGSHPGGGGAGSAAFFNVAFRNNEPMPALGDPFNTSQSPAWWRDKQQGQQLAAHDISDLHADVDFGKLAAGTNDDAGVPRDGPMDRILASRFDNGQGADWATGCFPSDERDCLGEIRGRLQPYAIYVPRKAAPSRGFGMTLLLHSLSTNYNQYLASRNQSQFGERGPGSIVITPESRGPDGFYVNYAAADVFEVWADVARHYKLDSDWTVITGYSMGGFGTFRLGEQFPDLFARAQPTVGESEDNDMVPSLRNIPVLMWNGSTDELVPETSYLPTAQALDDAGYRYELDIYTPGEHNLLAINDQFAPAAAFLGTATVDRDPAHVTYVRNPALDRAKLGFVADHAYWMSGLKLRSASSSQLGGGDPHGTVDAVSHGFGAGDPKASDTQRGSGTLTGGTLNTMVFTRQFKTWGGTPRIATANRLDLKARNISDATVSAGRAKLSCSAAVRIDTDGPLTVRFTDCRRTIKVRCLAPRVRIARNHVGRLRLARTRRTIRRRLGRAARTTRRSYRYCVRRGGTARVVFSKRGRAQLVATTAKRHRARGVGRGTKLRKLRRAYPHARRIGRGLMRGGKHSHALFGVRRGRVTYAAIASSSVLRSRRTVRNYLRMAGVRPKPKNKKKRSRSPRH